MGRSMFAQYDYHNFGTIGTTVFRLFQLMTLDNWFSIYEAGRENNPFTLFVFIFAFILLETFIFIKYVL